MSPNTPETGVTPGIDAPIVENIAQDIPATGLVPAVHPSSAAGPKEIAPGVAWIDLKLVNAFFVGEPGGPWAIVDTGTVPTPAPFIAAATARYGKDSKPTAIYLTHGHQDHVSAALPLATHYDVPIYAHRMELPYLTGKSEYPPFDVTLGGAFNPIVRTLSNKPANLGEWVMALPDDGSLPGMPGWEAIETPGHSPGHVSFYRRSDSTVIVGDAFITMEQETIVGLATRKPVLHSPPVYATPDWVAARKSVRRIADLWPKVVATGHGFPLAGDQLGAKLDEFAEHYRNPTHGRYVNTPAEFDQSGVTFLPPPVPDPLPKQLAVAGAVALGGYLIARAVNKKS